MTIDFVPAFQLSCGVQSYAWGKIGSSSKAAQYGTTTPGFTIDEKTPYAEVSSTLLCLLVEEEIQEEVGEGGGEGEGTWARPMVRRSTSRRETR